MTEPAAGDQRRQGMDYGETSDGHQVHSAIQREKREPRDALAGPRLTHDAQRLTAVEVEGHTVDGPHQAIVRRELDGKVADLEEMGGAVRRRGGAQAPGPPEPPIACGSRASRSASPRKLTASTVSTIMRPGNTVSHA